MSNNLYYCKKCGRILWTLNDNQKNCDCCNSIMFDVPNEYVDNFRWRDGDGKQALIEELVKTSPEFDQYLFEHRDEILAKQSAEFDAKMAHGKAVLEENIRIPKCPTCGSTNISKIGTVNRMISTGLFGLASSKIGKTHKCNNCGTTW